MGSASTLSRFASLSVVLGLLASTGPGNSWAAEKYPARPVEIVCGSGAGGAADILNRIIARHFEKHFKVPFVPLNKPGPSQMMMATYLATSRPDGHTLGSGSNAILTAVLTGQAAGYRLEDIRPVCQLTAVNTTLCVPVDSPWKTWRDFVEHASRNPGTKYGHPGLGSGPNYRVEVLNKHNKLGLQGVPFKGEGEVITMILGKHVPIAALSSTSAKTHANAGRLRILFSFDEPGPDGLDKSLPSLKALYGVRTPDIGTTIFLWVHRKTPEDIVEALDRAAAKMVADPEYAKEMAAASYANLYFDRKHVTAELEEQLADYRQALDYLGLLKK